MQPGCLEIPLDRFAIRRPYSSSTHYCKKNRLSYIPEDRQSLATCQGLDLLDNFLLTTRQGFQTGPWLPKNEARRKLEYLIEEFDIRPPNSSLKGVGGGWGRDWGVQDWARAGPVAWGGVGVGAGAGVGGAAAGAVAGSKVIVGVATVGGIVCVPVVVGNATAAEGSLDTSCERREIGLVAGATVGACGGGAVTPILLNVSSTACISCS